MVVREITAIAIHKIQSILDKIKSKIRIIKIRISVSQIEIIDTRMLYFFQLESKVL